jgi:hypothetical protein
MKPKVFIGSSVEALDVAYAIQQNLERSAEVTVWDQSVFELSKYTLESLLSIVKTVHFGVFVFAPDDLARIRDVSSSVVRDNVLFELGLFSGHLGRERCFIVKPGGLSDFHLSTDLLGIRLAEYDAEREDRNLRAALGSASNEIRQAIRSMGKLFIEEEWFMNESVLRRFPATTNSQLLEGLWLSRFSYTAKRNQKSVSGFQYDLEHLSAAGRRSMLGGNVLCSPSAGKQYWHELRVQVLGDYLMGSWFNTNTKNLGAFQLHIHTHNCVMSGTHIGNDNDNAIPHGEWIWIRIETDSNKIESVLTELKEKRLKPIAELDTEFDSWIKAAVPLRLESILG